MKKTLLSIAIAMAAGFMFVACTSEKKETADNPDKDVLYQVSFLKSLMDGNYDGTMTIEELLKHGDFGMGTFDRANGEMLILDGKVYQARWDGKVAEAELTATTPFANITYFEPDSKFTVQRSFSMGTLTDGLTAHIENPNYFYAAKVHGQFDQILVRSELPQDKPYKPLVEVMKTDERQFFYTKISGTLIGLYCPVQIGFLNASGWHLHFISDDKTVGGHVLKLRATGDLACELDATPDMFFHN